MFGNWLVEIYLENFNIIMEDYLEKVLGIINIRDLYNFFNICIKDYVRYG